MTPVRSAALLAAMLALAAAGSAEARNEYTPLFKDRKFAEIERLAATRLAADPRNADALVAKAGVILSLRQENRYDEAAQLAEQCIEAHPKHSDCHETLGNVLGTKAMSGGVMAAISYAGKIRDAYRTAIELDPANHSARSSLLQYYLMAPGIVGGGKGKAQDLVAETAKTRPAVAKLLQARIDLQDEKPAAAEAALLAVQAGSDEALQALHREMLMATGGAWVQAKKLADAERVYQEVARRFPDSAQGVYGLALVQQERGRPAEAIPLLEKALATEQRGQFYYRLGQCWQALNDKAKAIAAFEKALNFRPAPHKKMRADIEEQLKALRG